MEHIERFSYSLLKYFNLLYNNFATKILGHPEKTIKYGRNKQLNIIIIVIYLAYDLWLHVNIMI